MARVVFLGTPEAALPTLDALAGSHEVGLVVTQADRPRGRSRRPQPPPVKKRASELGLDIAQPTSRSELLEVMLDGAPFDVGVVVAYGRILRPEILDLPDRGLLNVHFSLLPRWRGAAPVTRALMAGDTMTGVTIIRLDEGLDTGPVLTAQAVDIRPDENAGDLTKRLAAVGARLLTGSIGAYFQGSLVPTPQSDRGATYADKVVPADRPINSSSSVAAVVNQVRALAPTPAATLVIDGETHKIHAVAPAGERPPPGTWRVFGDVPIAGFSDGGVELVVLQPPGKNPMEGADWARGRRGDEGTLG